MRLPFFTIVNTVEWDFMGKGQTAEGPFGSFVMKMTFVINEILSSFLSFVP